MVRAKNLPSNKYKEQNKWKYIYQKSDIRNAFSFNILVSGEEQKHNFDISFGAISLIWNFQCCLISVVHSRDFISRPVPNMSSSMSSTKKKSIDQDRLHISPLRKDSHTVNCTICILSYLVISFCHFYFGRSCVLTS